MIDWGKHDLIFIQSNISYIAYKYKVYVGDILKSLLESSKTVVFPSFNTDFNNGIPFDIRHTPSKMGVLSEYARTYPGAVRSGHPSYSFVAIGKDADKFNVDHFTGYGEGSPFEIMHKMGGKVGVLGLPNSQGNTFFHYVEEIMEVPYRFYKDFSGMYTDWEGNTVEKLYTFYCRKEGNRTLLDPVDDLLWEAGLYKGSKPFEGDGFRVIDMDNMFKFVKNIIKSGKAKGLLYESK